MEGLTLGLAQAARDHDWALDVALAVDSDESAARVYKHNFPKASVKTQSVEDIFHGPLGTALSDTEKACKTELGAVHALVGGPPCQGHSNLNNHTRRDDPKNALYLRMGRAAEVLRPGVVLIENVPTALRDKSDVVGAVRAHLASIGYQVAESVIGVQNLGVPQRRRRHILLATTSPWPVPSKIFQILTAVSGQSRDLRWAIGDLSHLPERSGIDKVPDANEANVKRMEWLLANNEFDLPNHLRPKCHQDGHTYKSMYGRLKWSEPAQTITSGFSSIGQGRYMHPDQPRALTVHEAARIQGFPDYFDFNVVIIRKYLVRMIGNAVPPELGRRILTALLQSLGGQVRAEDTATPQSKLYG